MKMRVYTSDTYLDIDVKDITQEILLEQLEEGNTLALTKQDDSIVILNMINVTAIEIVKEIE